MYIENYEKFQENFMFDAEAKQLGEIEFDNKKLHIFEYNDDGDEYVILCGPSAKSITDLETIWIPREKFDEFKQIIDKL